jgi:hypothetical protein
MARTSPTIQLQEIGGDQFQDLQAAQRSACGMLAFDLAQTIKCMIEQGALEITNNQIRPRGK